LQFGRSAAARITLVKAAPVKQDNAPAVFEFGGGVAYVVFLWRLIRDLSNSNIAPYHDGVSRWSPLPGVSQ
jgi:hypothetical protein